MPFVYLLVVLIWLGILTICLYQFVCRWDGRKDVLLSFLMSAALLPQLLGVLSLLSSLTFTTPGIAHYLLCLALAVLALLLISRRVDYASFGSLLTDIHWRAWAVPGLAAILVLPVLLEKLYFNSSVPLWCHDSLIYANEARTLVEGGSLTDIPWFGGRFIESVAVNHAHGPLFTAFLAQALLADDAVMRLAFQGSLVSMFLGVAALGRATGRRWAGTAAVLGFLAVPTVGYASLISSRDGFRIAPLLALIVIIFDQAQRYRSKRSGDSLGLAFTCYAAGIAHAINLVFLPVVGAAGLLAGWTFSKDWRSLARWLFPPALVLLLVSLPYLANLYFYGHPLGLGVYYPMYKDTAIWEAFLAAGNWGKSLPLREILDKIQHFYGDIQTWGLLAGLVTCMILGWKSRRTSHFYWVGLVAIMILLGPVLLTVDAEGVSLSGAFTTNLRYPMAGYAFLGLAVYLPLDHLLHRLKRSLNCSATLALVGLACLVVAGACVARMQIKHWDVGNIAKEYLDAGELRLVQLARDMPLKGDTWYTDNYSPAYYAVGMARPVFLFTRESRALLTSESTSEVVEEILARNIGMVSLNRTYLSVGWQQTMLYKVLSQCEDVQYLELHRWEVFIVQPGFGPESCRDKIANSQIIR